MGTYKKRFIIILILAIIAVGGSFLVFVGKHSSVDSQFVEPDTTTTEDAKSKSGPALAYVTGAIRQPGMYTLKGQLRVTDLVALAGGLLPDADANKVNMAQIVKDGMHITIPFIKEKSPPAADGSKQVRRRQTSAVLPVNVNTATVEELVNVGGITAALAAKIVEYRNVHGAFVSLEDLLKVKGMSHKQLNKLQDKITL